MSNARNKVLNRYSKDYENQLDISERKITPQIQQYYQREYFKGVDNFIQNGTTDYQSLFQYGIVKNIYTEMYKSIGIRFAKWYYDKYEKYIVKKTAPQTKLSIWESYFANYAAKVAAVNVSLVSGTAKKTLIKITQKLMRDPEFMMLGADQKARILRNQFKQYSRYQAKRLVRTESNRIANFATQTSALDLFGEENLEKTWIHSSSLNERSWHAALNLKTIPYRDYFNVGGELMFRPGEGSAENIINCRCTINYQPKPIPIHEQNILESIGVAVAIGSIIDQE
jgi:hypothetical protein